MIVISDTSILSNFIQIGCLPLLEDIFKTVIIPQAVYDELLALKKLPIQHIIQSNQHWINVKSVKVINNWNLDKGETEAITLALNLKAQYLLIDELQGRNVAKTLGLNVTGTLGILLKAKQKGNIQLVKPLIDHLKNQAGFWIDDSLYQLVLKQAGE